MLMGQNQLTAYDFKENCKYIEKLLMEFEYIRFFNHIVCVNMACFNLHTEKILTELEFFNQKENLIIFYEKIDAREKYDGDRQIKFLKEYGFYGIKDCLYLCLGVPNSKPIKNSIEDALKKAHLI